MLHLNGLRVYTFGRLLLGVDFLLLGDRVGGYCGGRSKSLYSRVSRTQQVLLLQRLCSN